MQNTCRLVLHAATKSDNDCFCNTIFGPVQGEVKLGSTNPETAKNLIEEATRSNTALTLQIVGPKERPPNLDQWLSGLDPSINVIFTIRDRLKGDAINAVWFTSDVPESIVRVCAFSLLQNGLLKALTLIHRIQLRGGRFEKVRSSLDDLPTIGPYVY